MVGVKQYRNLRSLGKEAQQVIQQWIDTYFPGAKAEDPGMFIVRDFVTNTLNSQLLSSQKAFDEADQSGNLLKSRLIDLSSNQAELAIRTLIDRVEPVATHLSTGGWGRRPR